MVPYGVKTAPFGSAGKLMPGVMARIVKPDGSLAKTGEQGELIVKSPSNALGYLNAPEASVYVRMRKSICLTAPNGRTKETFEDGWVHTGPYLGHVVARALMRTAFRRRGQRRL
jgi:4-coumarate--CoA ligase